MNEQTPLQKLIYHLVGYLIFENNIKVPFKAERFTLQKYDLLLVYYCHELGFDNIFNMYKVIFEKLNILETIFTNFSTSTTDEQNQYNEQCIEITGYTANYLISKMATL